ncbi:hypothetical protein [Streptomyces sp. BE133]|uniref:hypothetical protein n=1 Tax=Streptomyces sp. BE133 TaxID=3002523 RepID=UPI002E7A535D|nr:hypothetical protein [Streptomyces sp. BE133]MEE1812812.1 hypothetical protein [Streptomyces sp. BE133]
MSNDYAAIISSAIVALLIVGFVELHDQKKRAKEQVLAEEAVNFPRLQALFDRIRAGQQLSEDDLLLASQIRKERLAMARVFAIQLRMSAAWSVLCVILISALCLIFVWAAIDRHGPARWLAWYTLACTGLGILAVLAGAVVKGAAEAATMRRALARQWNGFDAEFEAFYQQVGEYEERQRTGEGQDPSGS